MELDWIWKSVLIVLVGTALLRISGRKAISQMTVAQTVMMISIGTLLVQPVGDDNIWIAFGIGVFFVLGLIILEYLQVKFNFLENLISGQAIPVIENGKIIEKNLKKLRLPVDKLEMRLRQHKITKISDVKYATIEANGSLGFELKEEAQAVTKKDLQELIQMFQAQFPQPQGVELPTQNMGSEDIFEEVITKKHKGKVPPHLN